MSPHLERAMLLLEQSRYDLATQEVRQHLGEEPQDPVGHALLARCLLAQEEFAEATKAAEEAVGLGPDSAFSHYALALVLYHRNHEAEAEPAIERAIELDPSVALYRSLKAGILFDLRRWQDALDAAEEGLALDAENDHCNNLRAMALVKLGRRDEAGATIESALERDPENAVTHANQGWTLLEKGETAKALEHFREALRLEPDLEWARQGVLEALKAHYPLYRLMLMYFLWMAKLSRRAQWGLILGGWLGIRFLNGFIDQNPQWAPWLNLVKYGYIAFVLLTWTSAPLFNLLLRLNRFGRMILSDDERRASNWIGLCVLAALACLGWWAVYGYEAWLGALVFALLMIPVSGIFKCPPGGRRLLATAITLVLVVLGPGALVLFFYAASHVVNNRIASQDVPLVHTAIEMLQVYGYGILGYSLLINFLIMTPQRR
jgi:tetratricopeptide (TPR) repeat protein